VKIKVSVNAANDAAVFMKLKIALNILPIGTISFRIFIVIQLLMQAATVSTHRWQFCY